MERQADLLAQLCRIADALDRQAAPIPAAVDWERAPAFTWHGGGAHAVARLIAPPLHLLRGIDRNKRVAVENIARLARGLPAHDMLLWGARGTGKSALLRSATAHVQADGGTLALVQVAPDALGTLPGLFAALGASERRFLVFLDDLGFAPVDTLTPRHLRSLLDGGVAARPDNVRLAVTSNRRTLVSRSSAEQDDPLNPRDEVDDQLALADRFGLSLGFHALDQEAYLAIVRGYCSEYGLDLVASEALEWSKRRGSRSGRVAWQFVTEIAGRAGRTLPV